MALKFGDAKGSAQKSSLVQYQYVDGDNSVRLVGDILPRYVYWVTGDNNKNIPMECLSFNRNSETFDNVETDWVRKFHPEKKCGWAYAIQCVHNGEVKILNLKKKLLEQVMLAADDLGDPTDNDTGWDINFKRVKTGPNIYNVEYQLQALKCKVRALSKDEEKLIDGLKSMEELLPRPTAESQKEFLENVGRSSAEVPAEAEELLKEDLPY
jgi:hypothetical protein|tara:strand:+ start:1265 stop:1897 length:633 start_codon:yes stop_codon:yes gene_type:complete